MKSCKYTFLTSSRSEAWLLLVLNALIVKLWLCQKSQNIVPVSVAGLCYLQGIHSHWIPARVFSPPCLRVCERYRLPMIILYVYIHCYLWVWLLISACQLVFGTVCADPVSHSDIRDTSQSFTSARSCSPRLRCHVWLRLTVEIAMNSERDRHTQTYTHKLYVEVTERAGITLLCCYTSHMFILNGTRCAGFEKY